MPTSPPLSDRWREMRVVDINKPYQYAADIIAQAELKDVHEHVSGTFCFCKLCEKFTRSDLDFQHRMETTPLFKAIVGAGIHPSFAFVASRNMNLELGTDEFINAIRSHKNLVYPTHVLITRYGLGSETLYRFMWVLRGLDEEIAIEKDLFVINHLFFSGRNMDEVASVMREVDAELYKQTFGDTLPERQGVLLKRKSVLTIKNHGNPDRHIYAEVGTPVYWDRANTNSGHENFYGGRHLYWVKVGEERHSVGLELGVDFEWVGN